MRVNDHFLTTDAGALLFPSNDSSLEPTLAPSPCRSHSIQPVDHYMLVLTHIMAPTLFGIFAVIGIVGNALVIATILINVSMRNATNILIMALSSADLIFIVCCVPFTALTYANDGWPLSSGTCRMYMYVIYVTAYCSVYTLVLMAFDRYLAVVHPFRNDTLRTTKAATAAVAVVWVIIFSANSPLALHSDIVLGHRNQRGDCIYYCTYKPLFHFNFSTEAMQRGRHFQVNPKFARLYYGSFFAFGYLLPLAAIIFFYSCLVHELLWGRSAQVSRSRNAIVSKRRVTRLVIVVIIAFALCWLPIQVVFLMQHFGTNPQSRFFRTFHVLSNCLAYANSSINPILYAFLSENFRNSFKALLCLDQRSLRFRQTVNGGARTTNMTARVPRATQHQIDGPTSAPLCTNL